MHENENDNRTHKDSHSSKDSYLPTFRPTTRLVFTRTWWWAEFLARCLWPQEFNRRTGHQDAYDMEDRKRADKYAGKASHNKQSLLHTEIY